MAGIETPEALLNDVVLQNIFKYLDYKDLKSCRQVGNSQWLRNSKKAWWARTNVKLEQNWVEANPILEYHLQTEINSNATNYKLEGIKGNYFRFWERFGTHIKELELSSCILDSSEHFCHVIYTQCPNLEKLVAFNVILDTETETDFHEPTEWEEPRFGQQNNLKYMDLYLPTMPMSWMELLSHYPKLQFLKAFVHNVNLFKTISMIRQHDQKMLNLRRIEIEDVSTGSDYDQSIRSVFLDPKLSLETIRIEAGKCQPETILDILDLHAKSLKKLVLWGDQIPHPTLRYPRQPLQFLKELEITFCVFPADIFKFTPNVRKVEIRLKNPSTYPILERVESSVRVNTCKDLRLYVDGKWGDSPDSDFVFFLRAFPNVETLHTWILDNRKFSLICDHLTKVVAFNALNSTVDVTGLLGFDPDSKADSGIRNPNITNSKGDHSQINIWKRGLKLGTKSNLILIDVGFVNADLQSFSIEKHFDTRIEMKNGSDVFKELKKLVHLKKFELGDYKFEEDEQVWEKIFAKYSGN